MKAQEIRERFLGFFAQKKHKIVKSSALLPKDDPTILFTNAGMNQFKNVFLGLENRTYKRAASVQKCLRVSGKHNDLEQVGRTNKHHTFFEMLGNFSFGDYFKEEAIAWAWELMTDVFKLDKERLYATVYEEDDEAYRIWNKQIQLPPERIFRFGKTDNYWAMGETGPCGPCSEIHYDLGPDVEGGDPYTLIEQGSDRFLELWNLVFMQFHQGEKGKLHPLPSPSIDTGMGLERMAAALQDKLSNFETDLFQPLTEAVSDCARIEYPADEDSDIFVRIIADHIRAVTFLIADGIMPSNEGRGYVLRRLIRRAFRAGSRLGLDNPFLYRLVGMVSDIMKDAYPELLTSAEYIAKLCLAEEERFRTTLSSGGDTFSQVLAETRRSGSDTLPGKKLFKLYDTFGFPLDLSRELAEEEGLGVDEQGFEQELERQRRKARESWKGDAGKKERQVYEKLSGLQVEYVGYEETKVPEVEVLALVRDGRRVSALRAGESGEVVLHKTPFYSEAGGQVGDRGVLKNPYFSGVVETAYYPIPELIAHKITVLSGKVQTGDTVEASIDTQRRKSISRNHTATHLLHASLRQIIGDHVKQSGSLVSAERLRFDFTHFSPLSSDEIHQIESLINEKIRENVAVATEIVSLEEGLKKGATAIFEEKYGEKVRMVKIDGFSRELCGGVHVHHTGEIGMFIITAEASIAAGMRRIEALTGEEALKHIQRTEDQLQDLQQALNVPQKDLLNQVGKLQQTLKEKDRETKALRNKMASLRFKKPEQETKAVKGVPVLVQKTEGLDNAELRELADSLKQKLGSGIVILGAATENKVFVVASVTKDLTSRFSARDFIHRVGPLIGGGGGGRPDFAQAGGSKPQALDKVLKNSFSILEELINGGG